MQSTPRFPAPPGLGTVLRDARTRARISLAMLGVTVGVSTSQLSNLECSRYRPGERLAQHIADVVPFTEWERAIWLGLAVPATIQPNAWRPRHHAETCAKRVPTPA